MNFKASKIIPFILPFTVIVVVPILIVDKFTIRSLAHMLIGFGVFCIGLTLMVFTISLFSRFGKGSLAPWNPPEKLVIRGPYKYVRNPMIIGVLLVLTGESIIIYSPEIFIWALIFFAVNNLYFIIYEEPNLEKRFGEDYKEYKKRVNRWLPRYKPYNQSINQIQRTALSD